MADPSWTAQSLVTPGPLRMLWSLLKRDAAIEASYRLALIGQLGGVLFWVPLLLALARLGGTDPIAIAPRYGSTYATFALLGVAFGGYLQSGLIIFPQRLRETQLAGTLEATLLSPLSPSLYVIALGLWDHVLTTLRMLIYLLCGTLFFGIDLGHANLLGALVVLALAIIAFDTLGVAAAGLVLVAQRGVSLAPLLAMVTSLLSGVYFPVEVLPRPLQQVTLLLPGTYALSALRLALVRGAGWQELLPSIGALVAFDLVLVPCSLPVIGQAFRYSQARGSLGQY
jgi:ABC-2 type transport system permease protein